MCCVLQGAERVFPSTGTGGKHGTGTGDGKGIGGTPVTAQDLPLESLWAAGLDEGMGFPQRCSYANQHSTLAATPAAANHTSPVNPDEIWRERNLTHRYTPSHSRHTKSIGRCFFPRFFRNPFSVSLDATIAKTEHASEEASLIFFFFFFLASASFHELMHKLKQIHRFLLRGTFIFLEVFPDNTIPK